MSSSATRKTYLYRSVRSQSHRRSLTLIDLEYLQEILLVSIILSISSSYLPAISMSDYIVCHGTLGTFINHGNFLSDCFVDFLFDFGFYSIVKSSEYTNAIIMSLTYSFFLSFSSERQTNKFDHEGSISKVIE